LRKYIRYLLVTVVFAFLGWIGNDYYRSRLNTSPNPISVIKSRPLEKYAVENLSKALIPSAPVSIEETLKENADYTSYLISFKFDPTFSGREEKKVTGLMNIPTGKGPFPLIVMFRGYVDQEQYQTGDGTRRAAEFFAEKGFITVAPDFLGYAGSDKEAGSIFESRFQTYTTTLTLINSVNSISAWDSKNIFLWGHSNGGQIALTVLEITETDYPTVLWAPVSKPFPYSILYYTDESDDRGKLIRRELSKFEEDYDVELFSLTNYLDRVNGPIQLHQGTIDDAVPTAWTDSLVDKLKELEIDVSYIKYPGADHNLNPSWSRAIENSMTFFKKHLN